jgi:hypothetical protein
VAAVFRAVRVLLVVCCALVVSACRITTEVSVDVRDDGSGTVTVDVRFDADAVARVPDLATGLRTDDLRDAGWQVTVGEPTADGVTYRATKPFAGAGDLPAVLAELTGPDGFLRDVALVRERSFAEVRWRFTATADLSGGVVGFGDERLSALLGATPLGRDPVALEQELGVPLADAVSVELALRLPAGIEDSDGRVLGPTSSWSLPLGAPPQELRATSHETVWTARIWAVIAGAAAFAFVVLLVVRGVRRRPPILRAVDDGSA